MKTRLHQPKTKNMRGCLSKQKGAKGNGGAHPVHNLALQL